MNKTLLHTIRLSLRGKDGLPSAESIDELNLMQIRSKAFERAQAQLDRTQLASAKKALSLALRSVAKRFPDTAIAAFGIGGEYRITVGDRTFTRHDAPDYQDNKLINCTVVSSDGKSRPKVDDALHYALCPILRMCLAFELAGIEDRWWVFQLPAKDRSSKRTAPGRAKAMTSPAGASRKEKRTTRAVA